VIGVVSLDGAPAPDVAGLPLPLRTLLLLQSEGAEWLGLLGDRAPATVERWRADDRVKLSLRALTAAPPEEHLAVRGDALLDRATVRALLAAPAVLFDGTEVLAVHRPAGHAGSAFDDGGEGSLRDVTGWRRVRSDAERAAAVDHLLQSLRKPQDGMVSRAINRTLSLAVTRVLCRTGVRPNTVSIGILAIGAVGALLATLGSPGAIAIGGLLFQTQSVLDGCDGELARLTFRGSKAGEWIDTVGDDLTNYAFFAGLTVGLTRTGLAPWSWVFGAVGLLAGFVASGIEYRYLLAVGSGDVTKYPLGFGDDPTGAVEERGLQRLLARARPLFKRDFFVFATMLATALGRHAALVMLGLFAAGALATLSAVLRSEWSRRFALPTRGTLEHR
jgi:phosphatidylglycerophosphate synthase